MRASSSKSSNHDIFESFNASHDPSLPHEPSDQVMASSSLSSSSSLSPYDVFLSFRGEDTRKTFTDHLYTALIGAGFRTFRDDEELEKGKAIGDNLMRAIEGSTIAIPVFSPNYADSKWCLKELSKIVKCSENNNLIIIPVFYQVAPTDVRNITGEFGKGFNNRKEATVEEEENWKNALNTAAALSGFDCSNHQDGCESRLVRLIVEEVSKRIPVAVRNVAKYPIGIGSRFSKAMKVLDINGDPAVRMIGLEGMGGLGKTTLAKEIFNKVSNHFEASCFVEDIREKAKHANGLPNIQEQIISELVGANRNTKIYGVEQGMNLIKHRLKNKRVLLILDNVDHLDQLKALAGDPNTWFGRGSRVIVTTRDADVLEKNRISRSNIYSPELLNDEESLALFNSHAFGCPESPPEFASLSRQIATADCGLPLAIVVHGSLLGGNTDNSEWEGIWETLRGIPSDEVHGKLKISYDMLRYEEQRAFLDIAFFLIDDYKEDGAAYLWDEEHVKGWFILKALKKKSLIKVDIENKLAMHDLIIEMARRIVREEPRTTGSGIPSRIWISNFEEADEFLGQIDPEDYPERMKSVEGIYVKSTLGTDLTEEQQRALLLLAVSGLMPNLRVLIVGVNFFVNALPMTRLPRSLRLLELNVPGLTPSYEGLRNTVILKLSSGLMGSDWLPDRKLDRLRVLHIYHDPIMKKVGGFHNMPNLVELRLLGTPNLSEVEESIGCLDKLEVLDMNQDDLVFHPRDIFLSALMVDNVFHLPRLLSRLKSLPETISNCIKLKRINLSRTSIVALPQTIGNLSILEELDVSSCYELTSLPDSICRCTNLKTLIMTCTNISTLPDMFGANMTMTMLKEIYFAGCGKLSRLPESITNCTNLEIVDLLKSGIRILPQSIGRLAKLEELRLNGCTQLRCLPESICSCIMLKNLYLEGTDIANLPILEKLGLKVCSDSILPEFHHDADRWSSLQERFDGFNAMLDKIN